MNSREMKKQQDLEIKAKMRELHDKINHDETTNTFRFDQQTGTIMGLTKKGLEMSDIIIPSAINGVKVKSIYHDAFFNNKTMKSLVIEDGIKEIGTGAFGRCTSLESVVIAGSVKCIPLFAFMGCRSIRKVEIKSGVKIISEAAFSKCKLLSNISLPDGLTTIEKFAFAECRSLLSINIPNSVKTIGDHAFHRSPIEGTTKFKKMMNK